MTIEFAASDRSTVGIEWELQLIDAETNDLRSDADTLLRALEQSGQTDHRIVKEMLRNTIELVSVPARNVSECTKDLQRLLSQVKPFAKEMGLVLATAGSHPFAHPQDQEVTDSVRYSSLVNRTRYWGQQMLLFGVHVHVGIEDVEKVLPIQRALSTTLGQLIAISASSPYWDGIDTDYASNRTMMFQQLPTAGIPRQFDTWEEFSDFTDQMIRANAISTVDELRWDVRPSPKFGTLEVRAFDAATNLQEVGAFAALTQCLVEHFSRRIDAGEPLDFFPDWYIAENKWRAARFGLDAELIVDSHGGRQIAREWLINVVAELRAIAIELGCLEELDRVGAIARHGGAYERIRHSVHTGQVPGHKLRDHHIREVPAQIPFRPLGAVRTESPLASPNLFLAVDHMREEMEIGHPIW
ncbi:glutamate--cysteine ligase [Schaalia sp. ZJ405]|uniref:glutamate--cysteine ligase n=1 Tax=Schaalia sp. ZJ405 TaxID=2709403 RepID=UPI0013EA64AC|nr:glutamate--cysteine ligase [Schaalia sp. ZJ405]QPK80936.1 glutamate--cysteine ligase [Schaalia sp. ZJ405]